LSDLDSLNILTNFLGKAVHTLNTSCGRLGCDIV